MEKKLSISSMLHMEFTPMITVVDFLTEETASLQLPFRFINGFKINEKAQLFNGIHPFYYLFLEFFGNH